MQALKVEVLNVGFELFAPQGEAQDFECSPGCESLCQGWGKWGGCVLASPTPSRGFSSPLMCSLHSVSF